MGYALVGSVGAELNTAGGATNTPSWGTGENRTAGNLLVLIVASNGSNTLPATPSDWTLAPGSQVQDTNATISIGIYYRIATGGDAAPTIAAATGTAWHTQLMEFSGAPSSPFDQSGTATGTSGTDIATAGTQDAAPGDLLISAAWAAYSSTASQSVLTSLNNGATYTIPSTNNNAVSAKFHYQWSYGFTTDNSVADQSTTTYPTTNVLGTTVTLVSFKLSSAFGATLTTLGVG